MLTTQTLRLRIRRSAFAPNVWMRRSSSQANVPAVIGSAPEYSRHLVIHSAHPASTWPSHLESTSPLFRELARRWTTASDGTPAPLRSLGFTFSEDLKSEHAVRQPWDPSRSKFDQLPSKKGEQELYSATLYPDFIHYPRFSLSSLREFESDLASLPPPASASSAADNRVDIYVCTHGTRDCRCGDLGEQFYQALSARIGQSATAAKDQDRIRVARIAHVGGHKFAVNVLVYRQAQQTCDWYGMLDPVNDVATLIDHALEPQGRDPLYKFWRGRLGISQEETKALYREAIMKTKTTGSNYQDKVVAPEQMGEQVEITFRTFEGEDLKLKAYEGESLMRVARRGDAPSILATCGGNCECATCHVHIAPLEGTDDDLPRDLPEMKDEEDEQLDFAIGVDQDSRLACQIPVTREMAEWCSRGGRIRLPRY
ncbi:uncharacterized protein JCM15063_000979 [Sporobolomyces koalae]|uniref:uncharacterized protein n=1 Tax=Sporobolomyces koalae TaxID=500713 RepID=UPI0031813D15